MSTGNTSLHDGRNLRIILLIVLAVVILVAAAYLWGNRLNADTLQANTQRSSAASATRYANLLAFSAVHTVDHAANTSSSLRVGGAPQMLSNLELRRVEAQAQGFSNLELQRARSQTQGLSNLESQRAKH
jgi:hypothetical protein